MKKRLYLHIGSPKTGTTSIQGALSKNRKILETLGFSYPGDDICHHWLYFISDQKTESWPRQFKGSTKSSIQEGFNRHIQAIGRDLEKDIKNYIISSEYFFFDDADAIENTLSFLDNFFDEIEVIAFVRDPVSFYASIQQQIVKASSRLTPPWEFYYTFRSVLQAWSARVRTHVVGYQPGSDSLAALCMHLGIDTDHLSQDDSPKNLSLSVEHMLLLEKVQKHLYPDQDNIFKPHLATIQKASMAGLTKPVLHDDVKSYIASKHADDLAWLQKQHGVHLSEHYPEQQDTCEQGLKQRLGNTPSLRDLYRVDDDKAAHFESALLDQLLRSTVAG